jgi:hypothetical protein
MPSRHDEGSVVPCLPLGQSECLWFSFCSSSDIAASLRAASTTQVKSNYGSLRLPAGACASLIADGATHPGTCRASPRCQAGGFLGAPSSRVGELPRGRAAFIWHSAEQSRVLADKEVCIVRIGITSKAETPPIHSIALIAYYLREIGGKSLCAREFWLRLPFDPTVVMLRNSEHRLRPQAGRISDGCIAPKLVKLFVSPVGGKGTGELTKGRRSEPSP